MKKTHGYKGIKYIVDHIEVYNNVEVMQKKGDEYFIGLSEEVVPVETMIDLAHKYYSIYIFYPNDEYGQYRIIHYKCGCKVREIDTTMCSFHEILRHFNPELEEVE